MNYAKHLNKLVLLGLWASCLSIRAEGTLPIPGNNPLPMNMNGRVNEVDERGATIPRPDLDLEVSIDSADGGAVEPKIRQRCRSGESFYPAGGSVSLGFDNFNIRGLCAPSAAPGRRQILATSEDSLVRLEGTMQPSNSAGRTRFEGELKREGVNSTAPQAPSAPGKRLIFKLDM
jgi:hypothetical protein